MNIAFIYVNNEPSVGRGAGYVAGAILDAGHNLEFFDTYYISKELLTQKILIGNFDMLMVSAMSMLFSLTLKILDAIKAKSDIPVLVGGIHPTIMGPELMEKNVAIDFLCVGEGESMVVEFLDHYKENTFQDIQNLCYRKDDKVIQNSLRPPEDLSKLGDFPWHLFPEESVVQALHGFLYINATRGCPYNCSYCCNGVYLKLYGKEYLRMRPLDKILAEVELLKNKYSPSLFYFGDEMLLFNQEYAVKLFEKLNVPFGFMARAENINLEIVTVAKECGCRYIAIGVECGNEAFRKKFLKRNQSDQVIENAFKLLKEANIFVNSFNMIGYPNIDDDFLTQETKRINQRIGADHAQVSVFFPLPGTSIWDQCKKENIIERNVNDVSNYFNDSVIKNISVKDNLNKLRKELNPNPLIWGENFLFNDNYSKGWNYTYLFFYYMHYKLNKLARLALDKAYDSVGEEGLLHTWVQDIIKKKNFFISPASFQLLASSNKQNGCFQEAKHYFERLVQISKGTLYYPSALFHLGEIALKEDHHVKAREYFTQCMNIIPDHHKCQEYLKVI